MTTRRRLTTDARRAELLEAGKSIFAEVAFDQLRTGEMARRAGASSGLLYHYFGNKRGYYVATMRHVAGEVLEAAVPPADATLVDAVQGALGRFLGYVQKNEPIYRALMRGGIGSDPEVQSIVESVRRTLMGHLVERLESPLPRRRALQLYGWIGFVEFAVMDWLETRGLSVDALLEILLEALLKILVEV